MIIAFADKRTQALLLVLGAVCLGWACTHLPLTVLAGSAGALAFGYLTLRRPGLTVGLLLLGLENGLPFLDTAQTILNGAALADYLAVVMIAILLVQRKMGPHQPRHRGARLAGRLGTLLIVWWLVTLWHSDGEPVLAAMKFGRTYLIFAVLVVLFPHGLRGRAWRDALTTLLAGTALYALGQIAITAGRALPWLVHPVAIRVSDVGLTRVYAFMSDAAVLAFSLSLGGALLAQTRRGRQAGVVGVLLFGVTIVLQQTRAVYLSLPLAIVALLSLCVIRVPATRGHLTGRAIRGALGVAVSIWALSVVAPHLVTTYGAQPLSRLSGVVTDFTTGTGNIGYRLNIAGELTRLLAGNVGKWATGLGFLDPAFRYFSGLPMGSIQNSDLGLLDGIMLIGVTGVSVVYAIAVLPVWVSYMALRTEPRLTPEAWVLFGLSVWIAQVLLASYSLGTLFQEQGQILVAFAVGLGVYAGERATPVKRDPRHGVSGTRHVNARR